MKISSHCERRTNGVNLDEKIDFEFSHDIEVSLCEELPTPLVFGQTSWYGYSHVYFIKDKNTLGIQKKVTAVLKPLQAQIRGQLVIYRTDSEQEVQNRRLSFSPILYNSVYYSHRQLRLQLQSTTPITTPLYRAYYRLLQKIRPPRLLLLPSLPRSSSLSEPRTSRSIISRIVNIA